MKFHSKVIIATLLSCPLAAQGSPTDQPEKQSPATKNASTRTGQSTQQDADPILISWLLIDNKNEVALARIAVKRAQNADVKQFAQKMIDDHSKMVDGLKKARGGEAQTDKDAGDDVSREGRPDTSKADRGTQEPSERAADANARRQDSDVGGTRVAGSFDHLQLMRDLGQKCQQSATEMLQKKQGAEFDRCYMGMQIAAHVKAEDMLEVFRSYASPTLRSSLEKNLTTVKQHKEEAMKIVKQLENEWKTAAVGGR